MSKKGKKYRAAREGVDPSRLYALPEAVGTLKKMVFARFNETVEFVIRLGIDPRHSDQMVRGTVSLPHGTGKTVRVLVFCPPDQVDAAQAAGADFAGGEDLVEKIKGGWLEFDVAVAHKSMMRDISSLGKVLGPRGLMPSPKAGTVTEDVVSAIGEVKAGRIEFKTDKNGNVQVAVGKVSFSEENLVENVQAVIQEIVRLRPPSAKGRYIKKAFICSTMSPAVQLDTSLFAGA
ncbi:MAG TPA: 50S ribosomal protein L1 [bacterium]|nr:50S ribosomal protein L1 [bacterium]HPQ66997.1 50S ribosomal protein L1 [bacterium]